MPDDRIAFPLETLLGAAERAQPLSVCRQGHLVVAERTHWQPRSFAADLGSIICDWVEHEHTDE